MLNLGAVSYTSSGRTKIKLLLKIMNKNKIIFKILFSFIFLTAALPNKVHASDPYADSVYNQAATGVYDPSKILNAPDRDSGLVIGFDTFVTLDMGSGEEGAGNLKIHFGLISAGTWMMVGFLDSGLGSIKTDLIYVPTGVSYSTTTLSYDPDNYGGDYYRYIRIQTLTSVGLQIDALEALEYAGM